MAANAVSLTSGEGGTGISSVNTASISPGANRLILVAVGSKINLSTPNVPTVSGAGMTWTQVATIAKTTPQQMRITLFRAMSASPGSGALTISYGGQNQERLTWLVTEISGVATTGSNGADAIVQAVTGEASSGSSFALTLAALTKASNATYGTVNTIIGAITPGSGYTEISEVSSVETNHEDEIKLLGNTSVGWSWSSAFGVGIAAELNTKDEGGAFLFGLM